MNEVLESVVQQRRPYGTPTLHAFGSLVGMTLSGSGTKPEGYTAYFISTFPWLAYMTCQGGDGRFGVGTSPSNMYACI